MVPARLFQGAQCVQPAERRDQSHIPRQLRGTGVAARLAAFDDRWLCVGISAGCELYADRRVANGFEPGVVSFQNGGGGGS